MKKFFALMLLVAVAATASAFNYNQGRSTLSPYPTDRKIRVLPDTLHPVFVNAVLRHGSRYPASKNATMMVKRALDRADSLGTITELGKKLKRDVEATVDAANGRWGQLDELGELEHRSIALRLYRMCPALLDSAHIVAYSSSSPRSIMSMYAFTHELTMLGKNVDLTTMSGPRFSPLMRFSESDEEYLAYRQSSAYRDEYAKMLNRNLTLEPLRRVLGDGYPLDKANDSELAMSEYYVMAGMDAMGIDVDPSGYFTLAEYEKFWETFNFREYLLYSATTLSTRPAEMAGKLLMDIIQTTDSVVSGKLKIQAKLRFGHAETLMPLLSLMQVKGSYYMTNYFDTVAANWQGFKNTPMACNLQMTLLRADSGKLYVRLDLNERPVRLLDGQQTDYAPWADVRSYLLDLVPIE